MSCRNASRADGAGRDQFSGFIRAARWTSRVGFFVTELEMLKAAATGFTNIFMDRHARRSCFIWRLY